MTKIVRATQKIFGSTATSTDVGIFGSAHAGSPAYSKDPETIQSLSEFEAGWGSPTGGGVVPPAMEDVNALDLVVTSQLAYLLQEGVAEYDAGTTYYINSIVKKTGTTNLYKSLVDSNIGNALTDITKWQSLAVDVYNFYVKYPYVDAAGTIQQQLIANAGTIAEISAILGTDATGAAFIVDILNDGNVVKKTTDANTFIDITNTIQNKIDSDENIVAAVGKALAARIHQVGSSVIGQDLMIQIKIIRS